MPLNGNKIRDFAGVFCHSCKLHKFHYGAAYFNGNAPLREIYSTTSQGLERKQALIWRQRKRMMQAKWRVVCSLALSVTIKHNLSCAADSFKDYGAPHIGAEHGRNHDRCSRLPFEHTAQLSLFRTLVPTASCDLLLLLPGDTWKLESNQQPEIIQHDNATTAVERFYVGIFPAFARGSWRRRQGN